MDRFTALVVKMSVCHHLELLRVSLGRAGEEGGHHGEQHTQLARLQPCRHSSLEGYGEMLLFILQNYNWPDMLLATPILLLWENPFFPLLLFVDRINGSYDNINVRSVPSLRNQILTTENLKQLSKFHKFYEVIRYQG